MKLRSRWVAIPAVALTLVASAGIGLAVNEASASVPNSSTGVITACLNGDHAVRIIDAQSGEACESGEQTVTWSSEGITSTEVTGAESSVDTSNPKTVTATCPSGTSLIAGGGNASLSAGVVPVLQASDPTGSSWQIVAYNTSGTSAWSAYAYAVCATFTS